MAYSNEKLVKKVNKEQGITFQPKVNSKMNKILVDPNSDVISRNRDFLKNRENKILAMKYNTNGGHRLNESGEEEKAYPSLSQYKDLVSFWTTGDALKEHINTRYLKEQQTFSKVTDNITVEEDNEEPKQTPVPVSYYLLNLNSYIIILGMFKSSFKENLKACAENIVREKEISEKVGEGEA